MIKTRKNFFVKITPLAVIFIIMLVMGVFVKKVNAFDYNQLSHAEFVEDSNHSGNPTYIDFWTTSTSTIYTVSMYIEGECTPTEIYPALNLDGTLSELESITGGEKKLYTFDFGGQIITAGLHYFRLDFSSCSEVPKFYGDTNPYSTSTEIVMRYYDATPTLYYSDHLPYLYVVDTDPETVEIIKLPDNFNTVQTFNEDEPVIPITKECYLDNVPCKFDFRYFPDMNGSQVSIAYKDGEEYLATVLIQDIGRVWNNIYTNHLDLPTTNATGTFEYELYYQRNGSLYKTEPFDIYWYATLADEISDRMAKSAMISKCIDNISNFSYSECTETENFIACGMKNALYWAFGISTTTCYYLLQSQDDLTSSFPLNIIYNFEDTLLGQEATTTEVVIAPVRWWNRIAGHYDDTGVSLLTTDTFEDALNFGDIDGLTVYEFYILWFKRLIWLVGFGYISFRILRGLHIGFLRDKPNPIVQERLRNRDIESIKTNRLQQNYYAKLNKKL